MSVKQKPNGKYLVDVRDEYGTRIERTFRTKTEAKAFEAQYTKIKYENTLINNHLKEPKYSMKTALDSYEITKVDLRAKSVQKYKLVISQLRHFTEAIGIDYVDEFTTDHATFLYNELRKEKAVKRGSKTVMMTAKPKTVNFYLTSIRAFFQQEFIKGHIKRNPMLHIKNLKVQKKKPDYYTVDELKRFFEQTMPEAYRDAYIGLLYTGMRFAELSSLTWADVDFENRLMYVRPKEGFNTKTHNAERAIPMNAILEALLHKLVNKKRSDKYVFPSTKGTQIRERRMLEICKDTAIKANIESRAFLHKFRSTYATALIHRGVPIQNIKELLGHWSVIETEIYAHNKSDHLHPDVAKLDNLLL